MGLMAWWRQLSCRRLKEGRMMVERIQRHRYRQNKTVCTRPCLCVCACCRGNYINASIVDKCVTQITATHVSEHRTCTHCSLWYNMWRELWKHGAASCSCKNLPNFSLASAWDTSANRIMDECFPSWVDFSVYYDLFSVKSRTGNSPLVLKIYILVTILLAICVEIFYVHLF